MLRRFKCNLRSFDERYIYTQLQYKTTKSFSDHMQTVKLLYQIVTFTFVHVIN